MPTFGPDRASCEILTFREGLLSPVAHDLLLRVVRFEIAVAEPPESVQAWFEVTSLEVVAAMRGGAPAPGVLGERDRREIERTARGEVLRADRFPRVAFTCSDVAPREGGYELRGALTLRGVTRPLTVPVRREAGALRAEVTLQQPEFGIRPYTAMLGALKVKPAVVVRVVVPAP